MKVIFLGTPEFSVPVLQSILSSNHKVVAVVTQPDRINKRGNKSVFSPVKELAISHKLPIYQFERISRDGLKVLSDLSADIMVTAAYGQILSQEVLDICPHGVINTHASILPKYRGSSPVQWALINGEQQIGVTIMQTALEVDSGDIILIKDINLNGQETAGECLEMLSNLAGTAVVEALDKIQDGSAIFTPQDHSQATFCKKLNKEDGKIDFNKSSQEIVNFIRGMTPYPSAFTFSPYGRLKILSAKTDNGNYDGKAGEIVDISKNDMVIKCGKGALRVSKVQGEGTKIMDTASYLRGRPLDIGTVLA